MSAGQHIDYDGLVRGAILEAKRSVLRQVLTHVAKTGLVGGHHFLIAFNTQAPGIILSKRLREKYPAEMTIVLQHRYWDLEVDDNGFEVKLTFDSIPERLGIPFAAIKAFYDPSVPYMMPFEDVDADASGRTVDGDAGDAVRNDRRQRPSRRPRATERSDRLDAELPTEPATKSSTAAPERGAADVPTPAAAVPPAPAQLRAMPRTKPVAAEAKATGETSAPASPHPAGAGEASAKVLDLSSFRKKK